MLFKTIKIIVVILLICTDRDLLEIIKIVQDLMISFKKERMIFNLWKNNLKKWEKRSMMRHSVNYLFIK